MTSKLRATAVAIAILFALSVYAQNDNAGSTGGDDKHQSSRSDAVQYRKLLSVFNYLNNMYVDKTDMAPLVERAIISMLDELDPHSSYIPPEEMKVIKEQFNGEFGGIGVEFNVHRDTVFVISVTQSGPAAKSGMRPNDRIVEVDGESIVGMPRNDIVTKLRGERGSKVSVGVKRRGIDGIITLDVTREKIPVRTVDAAYLIDAKTGYVKINSFNHATADELKSAVERLGNINALVLDLRGNGGGIMDQAVEMAEYFLTEGALILYTEGANVKSRRFEARHNGKFAKGRLVVLIDGSSASASEIVAGAIQDWDRGVIIGSPSFGKGLVQRQVMLPDSSGVRITISRYHTPTGRVIQRPYENGKRTEYYTAHRQRLLNSQSDTLAGNEERPVFKTLRNGRPVYGGGGITPDITVAQDTTIVTDCIVSLTEQGLILDCIYNYLTRSRDSLAVRYNNVGTFCRDFEVMPDLFEELFATAAEHYIECSKDERSNTERYIARLIKAYTARSLFSNDDYFRLLNENDDPVYSKAVEVIANPEQMAMILAESKKQETER